VISLQCVDRTGESTLSWVRYRTYVSSPEGGTLVAMLSVRPVKPSKFVRPEGEEPRGSEAEEQRPAHAFGSSLGGSFKPLRRGQSVLSDTDSVGGSSTGAGPMSAPQGGGGMWRPLRVGTAPAARSGFCYEPRAAQDPLTQSLHFHPAHNAAQHQPQQQHAQQQQQQHAQQQQQQQGGGPFQPSLHRSTSSSSYFVPPAQGLSVSHLPNQGQAAAAAVAAQQPQQFFPMKRSGSQLNVQLSISVPRAAMSQMPPPEAVGKGPASPSDSPAFHECFHPETFFGTSPVGTDPHARGMAHAQPQPQQQHQQQQQTPMVEQGMHMDANGYTSDGWGDVVEMQTGEECL
jgi:hypothetical protein